jgi:chromosome partitioning protein
MERAHRRHQRNSLPAGSQGDEGACQLPLVTDCLHRGFASGKLWFGAALLRAVGIEFKGAGMSQPHFIVFANEKGGTGKSTTAVHTAIALAAMGSRVAALDLDSRQRTMTRYLENRDSTMRRLETELPQARYEVLDDGASLDEALARLSAGADVIVIDTPGRDDPVARAAILKADTLVTPMNDSFVDLDLIGQVHPENFKVTKPSFYAELIWNSRTQRAKATGKSVDWVVLRNRLQHIDSHNLRRVGAALDELARRVGFRVIPGLGERVIYRELFPKGLTLLDLGQLGEVGIGHITARQELREMVSGLGIPGIDEQQKVAAAG